MFLFRFDIKKIRFISFILQEKHSILKKNVRYRSIFIPKKRFFKQEQLPINLFRFVFVLLFKAKQRFAYILLLQRYFKLLNVLLCFLFKAKQRFAHNTSSYFISKRFIFVSISILAF